MGKVPAGPSGGHALFQVMFYGGATILSAFVSPGLALTVMCVGVAILAVREAHKQKSNQEKSKNV